MAKIFLLFLFLSTLNLTNTSAAIKTIFADSIINKVSYKHNRQYFLDSYGKDDSAKALINGFFRKRRIAVYKTVIPVAVAGVSGILFNSLNNQTSNIKEDLGGASLLVGITLALVIYAAPVYVIDGQIKLLVFNRKKLFILLNNYNLGTPLPLKITKKEWFKYQLEKLKEDY